jgi:serine/threonine protein phosphatase PrpC/CRP-like cAMP-binding protein/serine/threonine protein kinase
MGCNQSKVEPKPSEEERRPSHNIDDAYAQVNELTGDRLTKTDINLRLTKTETTEYEFGDIKMRYAALSQRGFYPETIDKANQDAYIIEVGGTRFAEDELFFGVFDGHGTYGDLISGFVRDNTIGGFSSALALDKVQKKGMETVLEKTMIMMNNECHQKFAQSRKDENSGTTAVCVFVQGKTVHISNIGDSRAVVATREKNGSLKAVALSDDQTPYRKDERTRVRKTGARVCNTNQLLELEPMHDDFNLTLGEETDVGGDPPRVWHQTKKLPGCAFTRSIGDNVAKPLGVSPNPEYLKHEISRGDEFILVASDGVWEFLPNQVVVDMVAHYQDPLEACRHVCAESYRQWMIYDDRTDDITMISIFLTHKPADAGTASSAAGGGGDLKPTNSKKSALGKLKRMKVKLKLAQRPVRRGMSKEKTKRLQAIAHATEEVDPNYRMQDHFFEKSLEDNALIQARVRGNFLFEHLSAQQVTTICKLFEPLSVKQGDRVIRQGAKGDFFYVIESGQYDCFLDPEAAKTNALVTDDMPSGVPIFQYLKNGDGGYCFGELALLHSRPRNATVVAACEGKLWRLSFQAFRALMLKPEFNEVLGVLQRVEVLKKLSTSELQTIADCITTDMFKKGEQIITSGSNTDFFYIVKSGAVTVLANEGEEDLHLTDNDYFNDKALLEDCPAEHGVVVASEQCECYAIARSKLESSVGQLKGVIQKHSQRRRMWQKVQRVRVDANISGLEMFTNLGTLWESDTGALPGQVNTVVSLVRHKDDADATQLFMLRAMSKQQLLERKKTEKDAIAAVMREKEMLLRLPSQSRFFPQLCKTFADEHSLYSLHFIAAAAQFSTFVDTKAMGDMNEDGVRFYIAAMVMAVLQLQDLGIICRQVNPESILLDEEGYPHLYDFRDAKRQKSSADKSFTVCGKPEYQAPEQVRKEGHGLAVDCWALGVLLYELLAGGGGKTPFRPGADGSELVTYKKIAEHSSGGVTCPSEWSTEAADLVNKLLEPDAGARMDWFKSDVRQHQWLAGIEFQDLASGAAKAPGRKVCVGKCAGLRDGKSNEAFGAKFASETKITDQSDFDGYTLMNNFFSLGGSGVSSLAGAVFRQSEKSVLIRKKSLKKVKEKQTRPPEHA